jgi:AcrR family transcriptional regulator
MMSSKTKGKLRRSPTGRPFASLGRDARDLLLNAAVELFAEKGVAATTFAMIAQRAGLTPAMVHYYFHGRDELLDAAVQERMLPLITAVWDPIRTGEDDPAEMVRGFVERLLQGIKQMPWIPSMWIREVLNEGGLLRSRVLRYIPRERVRSFCEAVARGQTSQALNPNVDPLLLVFSSLGLVMVHCATLKFVGEIFQRGALTSEVLQRHITALLLDGLRPRIDSRKSTRQTRNKA